MSESLLENSTAYDVDALDIDDEKKEAVKITEGPLLIIAGPGSGKTKTLVERVVHLVSKGVPPTSIMVATFTEKAAAELVTRISNRLLELDLKVNLNEMFVGTPARLPLHSGSQVLSLRGIEWRDRSGVSILRTADSQFSELKPRFRHAGLAHHRHVY